MFDQVDLKLADNVHCAIIKKNSGPRITAITYGTQPLNGYFIPTTAHGRQATHHHRQLDPPAQTSVRAPPQPKTPIQKTSGLFVPELWRPFPFFAEETVFAPSEDLWISVPQRSPVQNLFSRHPPIRL